MQYSITLTAGVPLRQEFQGSTLVLLDTGTAADLDMNLEVAGFAVETFRDIKRGLKLRANGATFTGATFTAGVNTTIQVIVSNANIDINYTEGATVNASIVGVPVVSNDRGAPGTPVYVTGITYSDAPAVTLQDNAAVTVTSAGAALVAANAARRGLRITNIGTDQCAIGFTGLTWAKRCLILASGDSWVEERAANLAWYAITDAAKTASVTVQEVIA
ncbi:hypothetical protein HUU62_04365 [Rhodoferax sp. 4810]|nr:hypothetical protein [Rhodoferax jenense]